MRKALKIMAVIGITAGVMGAGYWAMRKFDLILAEEETEEKIEE